MTDTKKKVQINKISSPCDIGHNYQPLNRGDNGEIKGRYAVDVNGKKDLTKVLGTLYCTKCGETKDIVVATYPADRFKPKTEDKPPFL